MLRFMFGGAEELTLLLVLTGSLFILRNVWLTDGSSLRECLSLRSMLGCSCGPCLWADMPDSSGPFPAPLSSFQDLQQTRTPCSIQRQKWARVWYSYIFQSLFLPCLFLTWHSVIEHWSVSSLPRLVALLRNSKCQSTIRESVIQRLVAPCSKLSICCTHWNHYISSLSPAPGF